MDKLSIKPSSQTFPDVVWLSTWYRKGANVNNIVHLHSTNEGRWFFFLHYFIMLADSETQHSQVETDCWSMILTTPLHSIRGCACEYFHQHNLKLRTGIWLLAGSLVNLFIHHHAEISGPHQTFWSINKKISFPEEYLRDVTPFIFKFNP